MKFRKGRKLTELQQKTRDAFCALVSYGFKHKELRVLSGYRVGWYVDLKIKRCG